MSDRTVYRDLDEAVLVQEDRMLVLVGEVLAPAGRTLELMTVGRGKRNLFRTRLRNCVGASHIAWLLFYEYLAYH